MTDDFMLGGGADAVAATLDGIERDAHAVFDEGTVSRGERTVTVAIVDAPITFVVRDAAPNEVWVRAHVTPVDRMEDPEVFCEEALEANLFWNGTGGATLSLDEAARNMYLTERLDASVLDGEEALAKYVNAFTDTLVDWRLRARSHFGGVEALPASADFSPSVEAEDTEEGTADDAGKEIIR